MKSALMVCVALVVAMVASPALAGDQVSPSTLNSLGLGGMTVVSDAQGMEVRGMASVAVGGGISVLAFQLTDPATAGTVAGATVNFAFGAGANPTGISNAAAAQGSAANATLQVTTPNTAYAGAVTGTIGGFGAATAN